MFEYLIEDRFVSENDRIAVGVSGGADSMLLLWSLFDKQKKIGFDMLVIHINHHIRKETSERDQKFVENFCKKHNIKQVTVNVNVENLKNEKKLTLEEAARKLRYSAFEDIMKKNNLNKLFLAHHKNDQVESILMHIFRGSGIAGASGMRESQTIIRPLINLSKSEILKICLDYHIEYVVDETNENNDYSRNAIRNKLIPLIETIYPNATENIFRFGKRCEEFQNFIEDLINFEMIVESNEDILLKDSAFETPSFVVREYIKKVFEKLNIFEDIEAKHYVAIYNLQKCEVNKQIDLPHQIIARKTYSGIKFFKKQEKKGIQSEYDFFIGTIEIEGVGQIKTQIVSENDVEYGIGILYADYNKISNSALWRMRKLGDNFNKLGSGSKKLNDYFTDKKIDIDKRDLIPVLAVDNNILVVCGQDISENVKIDGTTDKIVSIRFIAN